MISGSEKAEMQERISKFLNEVFDHNGNIFTCVIIGMALGLSVALLLIQTSIDFKDWFMIIAVFVAIASAGWAQKANTTAEKTRKYEIFNKLTIDYGSEEMLLALTNVHEFYKKYNETSASKYVDLNKRKDAGELNDTELKYFDKLHNNRRNVRRFYQNLAWAWDEGYVKLHDITSFLTMKNLEFIPNFILPVEKELYKYLYEAEDYPLFFCIMLNLYEEARKKQARS